MAEKVIVDSYCGLICSTCEFKESHGCGGCVKTGGKPFYGECDIAKCCQDKDFAHCGECAEIPSFCGVSDCDKKNADGFTLCEKCDKTTCGKLHAYSYTDPSNGDDPPGKRILQCLRWAKKLK